MDHPPSRQANVPQPAEMDDCARKRADQITRRKGRSDGRCRAIGQERPQRRAEPLGRFDIHDMPSEKGAVRPAKCWRWLADRRACEPDPLHLKSPAADFESATSSIPSLRQDFGFTALSAYRGLGERWTLNIPDWYVFVPRPGVRGDKPPLAYPAAPALRACFVRRRQSAAPAPDRAIAWRGRAAAGQCQPQQTRYVDARRSILFRVVRWSAPSPATIRTAMP